MTARRTPAIIIGGALFSVTAAVSGYLVVDDAAGGTCQQQTEELARQQAELIEQLGASAPSYDFSFPESCFD